MIIVSLFGGLGNQMFQYACGKVVAKNLNAELKFDISHITDRTPRNNFTYRDYELGVFNIKDEIATIEEVRQFIPDLWNSKECIKQLYKLKRLFKGKSLYFEKSKFTYNKDIELVKDNTFLYGYFQTERYFENHRSELLQNFMLKDKIDKINSSLIDQIKSENSVSIHIRRGDYINSTFEILDIQDYYMKAIEIIQERVEKPSFYIFTNDYLWTEENFSSFDIKKTIVKFNKNNQSYLDMILMSNCKHNICANSSFSWWGAWLNTNPEKIVIAPEKWFKNSNYIESTYDLIPSEWIKI
jgi:hypothetical protein